MPLYRTGLYSGYSLIRKMSGRMSSACSARSAAEGAFRIVRKPFLESVFDECPRIEPTSATSAIA